MIDYLDDFLLRLMKIKPCIFCITLCNGCHNLAMLYLNICNIAIITVEGIDYCCILYDTSKSEAIPLLQTFVFNDCECL